SLSIFKPMESIGEDEEIIEVRGQKGSKIDLETFKLLQWDEEGLRYNIIIENLDLTFEDVLELTEQMEYIK
ncbi:MAG: outer membrane lipoprotein carrier protein LolA, partial [Solibacillus isronensis]